MNPLSKTVFTALLFAGHVFAQSSPPARSWWDGISVVATPTVARVDNISRTSHGPTRKDATTYELALNAGLSRQVSREWLLNLGVEAIGFLEPKFDLNNRVTLGPRVGLQHKFGLGPQAPVLQVDVGYIHQETRLGSARGQTAEAGVRAAKRLSSGVKVGVFGRWTDHAARSATFDVTQRTAGIDAAWDISDHWTLSGSASWLDGDIVTNASPAIWARTLAGEFGVAVADHYRTLPREVTELYGPGWLSYNAEAKAELWSIALGYRVSNTLTLEARMSSIHVVNTVDVTYPGKSWGASLTHRF